jgi:deoxycytidylate deaminase
MPALYFDAEEMKMRIEILHSLYKEVHAEMEALVASQKVSHKQDAIFLAVKYCNKSNPCRHCPHNFEWRKIYMESAVRYGYRHKQRTAALKLKSPKKNITYDVLRNIKKSHLQDYFNTIDKKKNLIMEKKKTLQKTIVEISRLLSLCDRTLVKAQTKLEKL